MTDDYGFDIQEAASEHVANALQLLDSAPLDHELRQAILRRLYAAGAAMRRERERLV